MAQVIDNYSAVMTNTGYIYDRADVSGSKTQYEYGTELLLPANYAERETNGFYPVIYPENGWINYMIVSQRTPNYKTVTDACTTPESLSISGNTMTITGGAGGDLNTLEGFGLQWRERDADGSWGSWSTEAVSASRTVTVAVNPSKVRQYRVRTRGSAGEAYYSEWVVCETLLNGNTAAATPSITLPANEAVSGSQTPVVVISCCADSEGDQMTLQRSIDGGDWMNAATVAGSGGTVYDQLPAQASGRHTIRYKLVDINQAESGAAEIAIVVGAAAWSRSIASGNIISSKTISHQADIMEMLNAVNVQRLYYGLDPITLPGTLGRFVDWGRQMDALLKATNACHAAAGQPAEQSDTDSTWPNAAMINLIRQKILSL